jgi:hypothetical protein
LLAQLLALLFFCNQSHTFYTMLLLLPAATTRPLTLCWLRNSWCLFHQRLWTTQHMTQHHFFPVYGALTCCNPLLMLLCAGKFLSYTEQKAADNVAQVEQQQ